MAMSLKNLKASITLAKLRLLSPGEKKLLNCM